MSVLRGPQHIVELANPGYMRLVANRPIIGRPVAEALPEIIEQGYLKLLDQVYATRQGIHGCRGAVFLSGRARRSC